MLVWLVFVYVFDYLSYHIFMINGGQISRKNIIYYHFQFLKRWTERKLFVLICFLKLVYLANLDYYVFFFRSLAHPTLYTHREEGEERARQCQALQWPTRTATTTKLFLLAWAHISYIEKERREEEENSSEYREVKF